MTAYRLFIILISLIGFSIPLSSIAHTQGAALATITDAADFAVSLYGTMLASQFEKNSEEQYLKLSNLYFTQDLNNDYKSVIEEDKKKTGELGCLDFNPITHAQDISRGFLVDNAVVKGNTALVAVHLSASDMQDLKDNKLTLHLNKTAEGFRVQDIDYGKGEPSLATRLKTCMKKQKS